MENAMLCLQMLPENIQNQAIYSDMLVQADIQLLALCGCSYLAMSKQNPLLCPK